MFNSLKKNYDTLNPLHRDNQFDSRTIVNFDETRVEWGSMANYTLDYKGKKKVCISNLSIASKAFTVLLSVRANGDKDPALIVFSGKVRNPRICTKKIKSLWRN